MAAPLLIAAGAAIKKWGVKKGAQIVAKKGGEMVVKKVATKAGTKLAEKGAQSAVQSKMASGLQRAKGWYDKAEKINDVKNAMTPQKEDQKQPVYKKNILNKFLGREAQPEDKTKVQDKDKNIPQKMDWKKKFGINQSNKSTDNVNEQGTDNKFAFTAAMFCAIIKDGIEIVLTLYLLGWLIPILSFFPTIILAAILFLSGKKSTMKMVFYLVAVFIDYFFPGINAIPITTIATFITFKLTPKATNDIKSGDINKGLNVIKSFIK